MLGAIEWLNHWGAAWTALVGVALWQSTLVACVVGIAVLALRRSSPAVRYWLWQLVAIKLLIVPVGIWSIGLPWLPARVEVADKDVAVVRDAGVAAEPIATPAMESSAAVSAEVPAVESPALGEYVAARSNPNANRRASLTWQGWLLVAWAVGVGLQMMRLLGQRWKLSRLLRATSGECGTGGRRRAGGRKDRAAAFARGADHGTRLFATGVRRAAVDAGLPARLDRSARP